MAMPSATAKPSSLTELSWYTKWCFSTQERAKTWKKLSRLISHGLSLTSALNALLRTEKEAGSAVWPIYATLLQSRSLGIPFSRALIGLASPEECLLLRAGEEGNFAQALLQARALLCGRMRLGKRLREALLYPLFLVLLLCALFWLVTTIFVPAFASILPEEAWKDEAGVLLALTRACTGLGFFLLLLGLGLFLAFPLLSFPHLTGRIRRLLDRIFPWNIYRILTGTSWLVFTAALLATGKSLAEITALSLSLPSLTPYLRERLLLLTRGLARGENFGAALLATHLDFPSRAIVADLTIYSTLPGLAAEMETIANEALEDALVSVERSLRFVTAFLLFFVTAVILFVLRAVALLEGALGTL